MNKRDNTQAATKADIDRLENTLKSFATKDDLQKFATKDDLKRFATKDDLKKFATKTELKIVERSLRGEILRVEEKVEELQEGQQEIKTTLIKLQNTLDGFVGTVDDLRTENEVGAHQITELDKRVTKLESSRHAA